MRDKEIMTLEKALFILRHGSAEGEHKYFEAITIIENEINRQKAEIERLEKDSKRLKKVEMQLDDAMKMYDTIKAEAIKEFAERLKEKNRGKTSGCVGWIDFDDIDNLLKELVENENEKI